MDPFPLTGDLDWIVRQSTYQSEGLRDLHVRQLRGVGSVPRRLRGSLTVGEWVQSVDHRQLDSVLTCDIL